MGWYIYLSNGLNLPHANVRYVVRKHISLGNMLCNQVRAMIPPVSRHRKMAALLMLVVSYDQSLYVTTSLTSPHDGSSKQSKAHLQMAVATQTGTPSPGLSPANSSLGLWV